MRRHSARSTAWLASLIVLAAGCGWTGSPGAVEPAALELVLAPLPGDAPLDQEVRRWQARVVDAREPIPHLDRLGWVFVARARRESDPGFYRLAERCAAAMAELGGEGPESWLLRAHALHGLHRFEEAERVARELVEARGLAFDHGLLGDVLLDRGDLGGAAGAYQRMADLRPDGHALARAARVRFLTGDALGAVTAMTSAARATNPRNAESFAWVWSRLALYQLEIGDLDAALQSADVALEGDPDAAPALLARGRILLARNQAGDALESLRAAARRSPLPDVLWTLAEALHAVGALDEEAAVRARLLESGRTTDPRGFSLYLASNEIDPELALDLAWQELRVRGDVYTWDALAWAQAADGRVAEARESIERALVPGTRDGRLFLHAGLIALASGDRGDAERWLAEAEALRHTLLPSERARLDAQLDSPRTTTSSS